jgi:hypothetical protein
VTSLTFHLCHGPDLVKDWDGADLPVEAAARLALNLARLQISQDALRGQINLNYRIDVEDELGRIVHSLPFTKAVQIKQPN